MLVQYRLKMRDCAAFATEAIDPTKVPSPAHEMAKQKHLLLVLPLYMRAFDADEVEEFRIRTAAGRYDLHPVEIWWRDRTELWADHGYELRPRLRPGWVPSWLGTDLNPLFCEDSLNLCVSSFFFEFIGE